MKQQTNSYQAFVDQGRAVAPCLGAVALPWLASAAADTPSAQRGCQAYPAWGCWGAWESDQRAFHLVLVALAWQTS